MEHLERLITDLKESLEREIREVRSGIARLETRFDTQAARLDRQGALLQTGSRWTGRMNDWSEKVDQALETKDREIAELRARLEKLERRNGNPPA
jgi:predicted  nucleic acid-binding Zn-ribbon protein